MLADDPQAEGLDALDVLAQVTMRIARLEARLEQVVGEREGLASVVTEQDHKLTELANAVSDLTRIKRDARDAIDGILKLVATLESRLVAHRGG